MEDFEPRARRVAQAFSALPYLRLGVLTGSHARGAAGPESDIDFLVVGKRGRLWVLRALMLGIVSLLGLKIYPETNKKAGRIDLTFFLAENYLDFKKIYPTRREFKLAVRLLAGSRPLTGQTKIYRRLAKLNGFKPNFVVPATSDLMRFIQAFSEAALAWGGGFLLEKLAFWAGRKRLEAHRQKVGASRTDFVISKRVIKLHHRPW